MTSGSEPSHVSFSRILGLKESLALGFCVSLGLVVFVVSRLVLGISGESSPFDFLYAAILLLPIVLVFVELGSDRPGSASPFQISRSYGSVGASFVAGWFQLAGLVMASALLVVGVQERLGLLLLRLFNARVDTTWLVLTVVVLAAANEWLSEDDRWRSRTILVWLAVGTMMSVLIWVLATHPPERADLPTLEFGGHKLTTVALLASSLWFVDLVLNHRRQMRRPNDTLRTTLLVVWFATAVFAATTVSVVVRSPSLLRKDWTESVAWGNTGLEMLLAIVGLTVCWLGVSRLVSRSVRLSSAMTAYGYLPRGTWNPRLPRARAGAALFIFCLAVTMAARLLDVAELTALAALGLFVVTVLVAFPHARRPARQLASERGNRLPLHPLFPGLAVAACVGYGILLPGPILAAGLVWLILGGLFYRFYARAQSAKEQQERTLIGDAAELGPKTVSRILVAVGAAKQLPPLLSVAAAVAKARGGEVLVLRVLPVADDLSLFGVQKEADELWQELEEETAATDWAEVDVYSMVRIAPSVSAGIVATANEHDADLLVLGSPGRLTTTGVSTVMARVFSGTSRPVVVVSGSSDLTSPEIVVATAGGPHAPMALALASEIAGATKGHVEMVSVASRPGASERAAQALSTTLENAHVAVDVETRVVEADSVESGVQESARDKDLLLLGASVDRLLGHTISGGLAMELAQARAGVTLIVKRAEAGMRFWQRRLWEVLFRLTPTLTAEERTDVYSQMRHSARADVDFYTLISLSSAIAILGLLLNSSAVIIGAMLVAPLMSPILALAQGIVQGSSLLIRRAASSTFKGMAVSISVGAVVTTLVPSSAPTAEILARVSPNLLDLGVALAAGAAAAYAISRSSVAAALPGVAISVALVPPLCVVGYGLGASRFGIAGGAMLLFLTNLSAIVLVGALVFVTLGFRPARAERKAEVRRAAAVAIASVLILAIPLGLTTHRVTRAQALERRIEEIINEKNLEAFHIQEVGVTARRSGYLVEGTVFAYGAFETAQVERLQQGIEEEVGVPVKVRLTVIPAKLAVAGEH